MVRHDRHGGYTWNAENRLVHLVSVSGVPDAAKRALKFDYDFQGRRVSKVVSNYSGGAWVFSYQRKYVYDGWPALRSPGGTLDEGGNLLAELDGGNTLVRSYMWGSDLSGSAQGAGGVGGLLAVDSASHGTQFVAYDGNGNVMGLVDGASGSLSARYEYDPFGQTIRANGAAAASCPFGFSTKYGDEESQFLYYGYRYYSPGTGRWLNRDPVHELGFRATRRRGKSAKAGDPNLYKFVFNNPITTVDAFGLLGLIGSGCPCGEALAQVNAVGGYYAWIARRLAREAREAAINSGLPGLHDGPADAFRHCLWSCRMTQELNSWSAKIIGDTHERCGDNPPGEEAMDLANNAVGRSLGTAGADCGNLCLGAVNDGDLVLEPGGTPTGPIYDYTY